ADITPAGGWSIINCDSNALEQEIRIVCADGSDDTRAACGKLFATDTTPSTDVDGAVGKIVRLPENCGKGPFALITQAWTPDDQSIPEKVREKLARRASAGNSTSASVAFEPASASASVALDSASVSNSLKTASTSASIALESGAASASASIKPAASPTPASASSSTSAPPSTSTNAPRIRALRLDTNFGSGSGSGGANGNARAKRALERRAGAIKNLNTFSIDKSKSLPPLNLDKSFNLVDQTVECGESVKAELKVDVDARANAVASVGVAASGTIVPPKVKDFGVVVNLNADIDGTLSLLAGVSGTADSGEIKLFQVGVPGLDIPGIITIGPSFEVNAQVKAALDLSVNANVGISYKVENAELVFPPSSGDDKQGGVFNVGDTPLKLSAAGSATATGSVEAHLIPTVNLGVSALGGIVDATVFLNLDASAKMELTASAGVDGSLTIPGAGKREVRELAVGDGIGGLEDEDVDAHDDDFDDDVDAELEGEQDDDDDDDDDAEVEQHQHFDAVKRNFNFRRPFRRPTKPRKPIKITRPTKGKPVLITKPRPGNEDEETCPGPVTRVVTVTVDPTAPAEPTRTRTRVRGGAEGEVRTTTTAKPGKTTTRKAGGVKTTFAPVPLKPTTTKKGVKTTFAPAPLKPTTTKKAGGVKTPVAPVKPTTTKAGAVKTPVKPTTTKKAGGGVKTSAAPAPVKPTTTKKAGNGGVKTSVVPRPLMPTTTKKTGVKTSVAPKPVKTSVAPKPVKTTSKAGGVKTTSTVRGGAVKTTSSIAPVKTSSAPAVLPTKGLGGNVDIVQPESSVPAVTSTAAPAATPTAAPGGVIKDGDATFGGCFTIDAGLSVNAGANANFFGLFDKNTKVQLFNKEFELFKKCFGDKAKRDFDSLESRSYGLFGRSRFVARQPSSSVRSGATRRSLAREMNTLQRRVFDLSCPAPDASGDPASLTPLADEVVNATDIKTV
ncbi:hypothetical protein CVT24_008115, partial [Panaeolus cyanescens]